MDVDRKLRLMRNTVHVAWYSFLSAVLSFVVVSVAVRDSRESLVAGVALAVFVSGIAVSVLFIPYALLAALARVRSHAARCVRCGYPTPTGAERCPECGDDPRHLSHIDDREWKA